MAVGKVLQEPSVVCFFGDLGAGKTTFIKGLALGATQLESSQVSSPTFSYLNIYKGKKIVYHFDLYRLRDMDEFLSMGFDEYLYDNGICCIEWSEKIQEILPKESIKIILTHKEHNQRAILIKGMEEHGDLPI